MTQQTKNSDEIDLRELLRILSKFIQDILNSFINVITRIRATTLKYKTHFVFITTMFLVVSVVYYSLLSNDVFGSSMLIRSPYFNTQLLNNTIEKLDALAKEKDKSTLAKSLNIDLEVAESILGFECETFVTEDEKVEVEILKEKLNNLKLEEDIINSITAKIELRNPNTFKITVLTEENAYMSTLDSALFNYFSLNPFIKKRIEINRETLMKKRSKLEKEQVKIDSLKSTIFNVYASLSKNTMSQGSDNVILAGQEITDPLRVFNQDIDFNDQILNIDRSLYLQNEIEIIEGFTPFNKPVSIGLVRLIAYTILLALGFTYLLIILIELNKFLKAREKELNLS